MKITQQVLVTKKKSLGKCYLVLSVSLNAQVLCIFTVEMQEPLEHSNA